MNNQDEIKEELTEIGVDTVESVVQLVLDDPIFSSLPILGTTYKLGKIAYSGSHSDEVQVSCPSPETARLLSVEVYLMRSGAAIFDP